MGICSSCLGFGRRDSQSEPSDSAHLLGDPYQQQYGSISVDQRHSPQVDPEEIRRQRDALERLCAQTLDKLIDVTQTTNADEGSKIANDYTRLFAERFAPQTLGDNSRPSSSEATSSKQSEMAWLSQILEEEHTRDTLKWRTISPPGTLIMPFEEVLGYDCRNNGGSLKGS